VEQLVEECDVPKAHVGHLALVVPMFVGAGPRGRVRRVAEIGVLEPAEGGYTSASIARWRRDSDDFAALSSPLEIETAARRLRIGEAALMDSVGERSSFLRELLNDGVADLETVQERVRAFGSRVRPSA
jgi:hypothetical protein